MAERVSTFRMPSEYERAAMEARRRQRMAEMLAQQAYDPFTVQGAPIPSAAPLVQGLQAFLTARQLRKAEEALEKAEAADVEGYRKLREELGPRSQIAAPTNTQIAESVGMPQIAEDGTVSYGQATMPKLGMEQVMPTAQERERALEDAFVAGTPRARKYAEFLMAKEPQSKLMEFGDQLLNVTGGTATPVTMGGKPVTAPKAVESAIGKPSPGDFTPASLAQFARTGNYADLVPVPRPAPVTNVYSTTAVAGVDEQGNPIFFQPSKSGGEPSIIEGVRPSPKGMNESQSKAAGFADRVTEANPVFEMGPVGIEANVLSDIPFGAGNFAMTPQQQLFLQAERNFINAILRRESGATIMPDEFKNARQQYIPQPGDNPEVLEQKRKNRNTVLNSLQRDAGPQYKPPVSITGSGFSQSGWGEAQVVR